LLSDSYSEGQSKLNKTHRNSLQSGYKLHWYEITKVLGQGGFGITYLARDTNLEKDVAIKEYLPIELAVREKDHSIHPLTEDRGKQYKWGLDRFISEARTLSKFEHPNIVRVHAVFEENNTGYMVMSYEAGRTLQELLSGRKTMEEAALLKILIPILGGLELVHEAGFIHRDIKPDNIFIREDGSPVLLDFGSARQALGEQTKTLTSLVTPGYAPFEQYYSKSDEQGPWTDIYGLGATLYRAISGIAPVDAVDRSKHILDGNDDRFVLASELGEGKYSSRFLKAIDHALQFKQKERPQTTKEWKKEFSAADDLAEIKRIEDNENQPTQPGTQVHAKTIKRKLPVKLLVFILTSSVLIGAGFYFQDYFLNELDQWQQTGEVTSLLNDAKMVNPAGDEALSIYRRVLELQPDNAEAYLGLQSITGALAVKAREAIKAENFSDAETILAEASAILPDVADIQLANNELEQAKITYQKKLDDEKRSSEQLESAIKNALAAAEKGQVTETFSLIDQARSLDVEEQQINEIKSSLRQSLETQITIAAAKAKQAMKNNNTQEARQYLQQAKDTKAQLFRLKLPQAEIMDDNKANNLLNISRALAEEGNLEMAIEKFDEARSSVDGDLPKIQETKKILKRILEKQATDAANDAQQAMKVKDTASARIALKKAKDIKAKLEKLK